MGDTSAHHDTFIHKLWPLKLTYTLSVTNDLVSAYLDNENIFIAWSLFIP